MFEKKQSDNFTTESPIRAFTEFQVDGTVAIGKGFRPSLAHLGRYLDAMYVKEGWQFVQVLMPHDGQNDPTIMFRRTALAEDQDPIRRAGYRENALHEKPVPPFSDDLGAPHDEPLLVLVLSNFGKHHESTGIYKDGGWHIVTRMIDGKPLYTEAMRTAPLAWRAKPIYDWHPPIQGSSADTRDKAQPLHKEYQDGVLVVTDGFGEPAMPTRRKTDSDDPINPKHYGGTECAEIGERLSANSYQVLKYNWRLGEKDSPCIELGKALWYLDREINMTRNAINRFTLPEGQLPSWDWFEIRCRHMNAHVQETVEALYWFNKNGNVAHIVMLRKLLQDKLDSYNGCTEWGRGLQP